MGIRRQPRAYVGEPLTASKTLRGFPYAGSLAITVVVAIIAVFFKALVMLPAELRDSMPERDWNLQVLVVDSTFRVPLLVGAGIWIAAGVISALLRKESRLFWAKQTSEESVRGRLADSRRGQVLLTAGGLLATFVFAPAILGRLLLVLLVWKLLLTVAHVNLAWFGRHGYVGSVPGQVAFLAAFRLLGNAPWESVAAAALVFVDVSMIRGRRGMVWMLPTSILGIASGLLWTGLALVGGIASALF